MLSKLFNRKLKYSNQELTLLIKDAHDVLVVTAGNGNNVRYIGTDAQQSFWLLSDTQKEYAKRMIDRLSVVLKNLEE